MATTKYRKINQKRHTCAYCGTKTRQRGYITDDNRYYPPCCSKDTCLDQWEPRPIPAHIKFARKHKRKHRH